MKLIPLMYFIIFYDALIYGGDTFYNEVKWNRVHLGLLLLMYPIVLFQKYYLNLHVDMLSALTAHAHSFGFISLFSSLYFFTLKKTWTYLFLLLIALFFAVIVDFKIGLISFIISLVSAHILTGTRKTKMIALSSILLILVFFGFLFTNPQYLPDKFRLVAYFFAGNKLAGLFNLNSTFPTEFELIRGYIQLYTEVLDSKMKMLFGVGPGNYASNIALIKEKHYAVKYVLYYRDIIDSRGIGNGSLLSRDGVLINIIAEYGCLGAILYMSCFIKIVLKPITINFNTNIGSQKEQKYLYLYYAILISLFMEVPIFPILKEGLFLVGVSYFGMLLIRVKKDV
ncbi:MAG: hypothetical protein OCD76_15315 [Reichenbachiella sp.]